MAAPVGSLSRQRQSGGRIRSGHGPLAGLPHLLRSGGGRLLDVRSCSAVAAALGRPPVPVTPLGLCDRRSSLYRAVRQYKSGEPAVAGAQVERLAVLLGRWWPAHRACVMPAGCDLVVVVPSGPGGRPPPHPLSGVLARVPGVGPVASLLGPGPASVGHRRPDRHSSVALDPQRRLPGARVLLVDDLYTSGAHLQSAAQVVLAAGARTVRGITIGRLVGADGPVATAGPDRCPRCPETGYGPPIGWLEQRRFRPGPSLPGPNH